MKKEGRWKKKKRKERRNRGR
jgi:hypothetical protein